MLKSFVFVQNKTQNDKTLIYLRCIVCEKKPFVSAEVEYILSMSLLCDYVYQLRIAFSSQCNWSHFYSFILGTVDCTPVTYM